jgi:undecaprenyl pyrophosphate phosphatase UppP
VFAGVAVVHREKPGHNRSGETWQAALLPGCRRRES